VRHENVLGVRYGDHADLPPEMWNLLESLTTSLFRALIKVVGKLRVEAPGHEQERVLFVEVPQLLFRLVRELATWWWSHDRGFLGCSLNCPKCRQRLTYKGDVAKAMVSPFGVVRPRRAYYWCSNPDCDYSVCPLDQRLGLDGDGFLPSVQEMVVWLTSLDPYGKCLEYIGKLLQFSISHRSAWLITQKVGNLVKAREDEQIARAFADPKDSMFPAAEVKVPEVGVVMMDGTCGRIDREEVHDDESAEEEDLDTPAPPPDFREVKLGLAGHLVPPKPKACAAVSTSERDSSDAPNHSARRATKRRRKVRAPGEEPTLSNKKLAVHLGSPLRLFQLILLLVHRLGLDRSGTLLVIGDGARWIWRGVREHLTSLGPTVVEILDYYHAVEHLWKLSNSVFGQGTAAATAWVRAREAELLEGRLSDFFESLQKALEVARERAREMGESLTETVQKSLTETVQKELNYFINNADRIHYAEYLRQGYLIGSGAMEGSCKHHVKERIDRAGMHWSPEGAMAVLRNRTLIKNGDWEAFWNETAGRRWHAYQTLTQALAG
jgi:hypothetical protein